MLLLSAWPLTNPRRFSDFPWALLLVPSFPSAQLVAPVIPGALPKGKPERKKNKHRPTLREDIAKG
jgi:hypothetical protein